MKHPPFTPFITCDCCGLKQDLPVEDKPRPIDGPSTVIVECTMVFPIKNRRYGGCCERVKRDLCPECLNNLNTRIRKVWNSVKVAD